jgi:hypothetical protein
MNLGLSYQYKEAPSSVRSRDKHGLKTDHVRGVVCLVLKNEQTLRRPSFIFVLLPHMNQVSNHSQGFQRQLF